MVLTLKGTSVRESNLPNSLRTSASSVGLATMYRRLTSCPRQNWEQHSANRRNTHCCDTLWPDPVVTSILTHPMGCAATISVYLSRITAHLVLARVRLRCLTTVFTSKIVQCRFAPSYSWLDL
jgi:hypothetical protein